MVGKKKQPKKMVMKRTHGQSVVDFLMTYSWGLLVALVAISILFRLGMAGPQIPSSCVLQQGFTCTDYTVYSGGGLALDLGHATGRPIIVTSIGCASEGGAISMVDVPDVTVASGSHGIILDGATPVCSGVNGTQFKGTVVVEYHTIGSGLTRNATGQVIATVQPALPATPTPTPTPAPTATPTPTPSPTPTPTPVGTAITACPFTISSPGAYYLDRNLSSSGTCITIEASGGSSSLDCRGYWITGTRAAGSYAIYDDHGNSVNITNCSARDYYDGLQMDQADYNRITNCNFSNNVRYGIYLDHSNNRLTGNIASYNGQYGIYVDQGANNLLTGNTFNYNTRHGIYDDNGSNNTYSANTMCYNGASYKGIKCESAQSGTGNVCTLNSCAGVSCSSACP